MKSNTVLITFDTHTPYLAFRVRSLQAALVAKRLQDQIRLEVVLIALDDQTYRWEAQELSRLYGGVRVRALTRTYRDKTFTSYYLKLTTLQTVWQMLRIALQLRPRVALVGGYNRPESIALALLGYVTGCKVGPCHDSRFNDVEQFSKRLWLESIKGLVLRHYDFFMCAGRECVEYSRFLVGQNKPALERAWDIVDNETVARLAEDSDRDADILQHLGVERQRPFFIMPIRFLPKKNALFVIDAYDAYRRRSEAAGQAVASLVICGTGPLEAQYHSHVEQLGLTSLVRICPWLRYEDVPRAVRLAQCLILASTHDQWGMTINEALAAGTPVLCSSRAGAHELVQNYVNGFTFHPWAQGHLTDLLYAMGTDKTLVEKLRLNAASSVREFSVQEWLSACFDVFTRFGILNESQLQEHARETIQIQPVM